MCKCGYDSIYVYGYILCTCLLLLIQLLDFRIIYLVSYTCICYMFKTYTSTLWVFVIVSVTNIHHILNMLKKYEQVACSSGFDVHISNIAMIIELNRGVAGFCDGQIKEIVS